MGRSGRQRPPPRAPARLRLPARRGRAVRQPCGRGAAAAAGGRRDGRVTDTGPCLAVAAHKKKAGQAHLNPQTPPMRAVASPPPPPSRLHTPCWCGGAACRPSGRHGQARGTGATHPPAGSVVVHPPADAAASDSTTAASANAAAAAAVTAVAGRMRDGGPRPPSPPPHPRPKCAPNARRGRQLASTAASAGATEEKRRGEG